MTDVQRPEGEPDEVEVTDDPIATLRSLVLTFEAHRQQIASLVLWELDRRYSETREDTPIVGPSAVYPVKRTRAVKGMPPMMVQIIKRAEQWHEARQEADIIARLIADAHDAMEGNEQEAFRLVPHVAQLARAKVECMKLAHMHQEAAERLLCEDMKISLARLKSIESAVEKAEQRELKILIHREKLQKRLPLSKMSTQALIEQSDAG